MEEEWFCFIQEANFQIIDKQVLILLSNSQVVSRNSTFFSGYHCRCWQQTSSKYTIMKSFNTTKKSFNLIHIISYIGERVPSKTD